MVTKLSYDFSLSLRVQDEYERVALSPTWLKLVMIESGPHSASVRSQGCSLSRFLAKAWWGSSQLGQKDFQKVSDGKAHKWSQSEWCTPPSGQED